MKTKTKFLFLAILVFTKISFAQMPTAGTKITAPYFISLKKLNSTSLPYFVIKNYGTSLSGNLVIDAGANALPARILISSNFYMQQLGFFCKKELQLQKAIKIPFVFRLGSVEQCNWLEGKQK